MTDNYKYAVSASITVHADTLAERLQYHCAHNGGARSFLININTSNHLYLHAETPAAMRAAAHRMLLLADDWQDDINHEQEATCQE
jgi:hypothetical protein